MPSAKCQSFCSGHNVLTWLLLRNLSKISKTSLIYHPYMFIVLSQILYAIPLEGHKWNSITKWYVQQQLFQKTLNDIRVNFLAVSWWHQPPIQPDNHMVCHRSQPISYLAADKGDSSEYTQRGRLCITWRGLGYYSITYWRGWREGTTGAPENTWDVSQWLGLDWLHFQSTVAFIGLPAKTLLYPQTNFPQ